MKHPLIYHLCPHCYRAVPRSAGEKYCPNDGTKLLEACSHCGTSITSPYARYCTSCGQAYEGQDEKDEVAPSGIFEAKGEIQ